MEAIQTEQRIPKTRREVIDYLWEIRRAEGVIEILSEEIAVLRDRVRCVRGVSYDGDRVQSSEHKGVAEMVDEIVDRERQLLDQIAYAERRRAKLVDEVQRVTPTLEMLVLYDRFVQGLSLREIARQRHYNGGYLKQISARAVGRFAELKGWEIVPEEPRPAE